MQPKSKQQLLPLQSQNQLTLTSFVHTEFDVHLLAKKLMDSNEPQQILFQGVSGSGKTHILQSLCHFGYRKGLRCQYWPLQSLSEDLDQLVEGCEQCNILCLDDIHYSIGNNTQERALFNLINRCQMSDTHIIFSSQQRLNSLPCQLPDLKSRLSGMLYQPLKLIKDDEKLVALKLRTSEASIHIPTTTLESILKHSPSNNCFIFEVLESLIKVCLVDRIKPSAHLAKKLISQKKLDWLKNKKA